MWHPRRTRNHRQLNTRNQRGAAFMVMLVIMIIGVITVLTGALGKVTLQTALNEKNGGRLAQAKEVLLGYVVNGTGGGQRPGDLPYPDRLLGSETPPNYDGNTDSCPALQTAPTPTGCLGRLPWGSPLFLSMGSPSENDPTGFMPWYAVSGNMVDQTCVSVTSVCPSNPLQYGMNSELLNAPPPPHTWLTVRDMSGNVLSNRVAFVLIIPGPILSGKSRPLSTSQGGPGLAGANQYLDSITVPAGCTAPCVPGTYSNSDADDDYIMGDEHRWIDDPSNPGHQIEDASYNFNDKLTYVTIDELMPLIEKRIAREVKNCLDSYAAVSANKYPWAAPISPLAYTSIPNTRFGRLPDVPIALIPGAPTQLNAGNATGDIKVMLDAMAALQTAVDNCGNIGSNATTRAALASAGATLEQAASTVANSQPTVPAIDPNTVTDFAITAGQRAQTVSSPTRCEKIYNQYHGTTPSSTSVQTNLTNANSGLVGINTIVYTQEDTTMASSWTAGCFVAGTYWDEWKRLVLYQVSNNYRPQSTGVAATPCGVTGTCLSINGSGNPNAGSGSYRASIVMAGKKIGTQTRTTQTVDQYLELNNQTAPVNLTFDTYKPTDTASYSNVNDLVLCLDGKVNCK